MIISRYSQTFFQANTYVIVPDKRSSEDGLTAGMDGDMPSSANEKLQALVVDPGAGSADWVTEELKRRNVQLGAVLLTHGHADHVWDAQAVAGTAPVYVPSPDMYRLDDPLATLGMPETALGFTRMGKFNQWKRPENLRPVPSEMYAHGYELIPGLTMRSVATPGHTEGSSIFLFSGCVFRAFSMELETTEERTYLLAGDVLFAGSVGRTDLPGGDQYEMNASLRFIVNAIKPDVYVLPGHGGHTTIWNEMRNNPYLHAAMS